MSDLMKQFQEAMALVGKHQQKLTPQEQALNDAKMSVNDTMSQQADSQQQPLSLLDQFAIGAKSIGRNILKQDSSKPGAIGRGLAGGLLDADDGIVAEKQNRLNLDVKELQDYAKNLNATRLDRDGNPMVGEAVNIATTNARLDDAQKDRNSREDLLNKRLDADKIKAELKAAAPKDPKLKVVSEKTLTEFSDLSAAMQAPFIDLENAVRNSNIVGPIKGSIGRANKYNDEAQKIENYITTSRQLLGKYLEGGKLIGADEAKYEKMLPALSDTPETVVNKIENMKRIISKKIGTQLDSFGAAGYNVEKLRPIYAGLQIDEKGGKKSPAGMSNIPSSQDLQNMSIEDLKKLNEAL